MALRELGDAQLRQLMEDLWQEAAQRELTTSPIGPPSSHWRTPASGMDADLEAEEVTLQGEGMRIQQTANKAHRPPSYRGGCWLPPCTLVARLRLWTPRIKTLSGDATLGKTEVSFEQWYHEVQCVKDHYLESVVWESIMRSLKEAAADIAWYMGPTTSVAHILRKLLVIFSTVASFEVLMQNFYSHAR